MASVFDGLVESLEKVTLLDRSVQEKLKQCMSPDFGLLEVLHADRTVSDQEVADIRKQGDVEGRNRRLLEIIVKRGQIQKLARALLTTKQLHLVAFLASNGSINSEFEYNWPLSESQLHILRILDQESDKLTRGLLSQDLLKKLVEREAFTDAEGKLIESKDSDHEKTKAFLEILRRGSQKNYFETVTCLRIVGQGYIASLLKKGVSEIVGNALPTDLSDLPPEIYRLIVVKAYIRMLVTSPERHPEKDIFRGLCNVNELWHKMVTNPSFREGYEYHISGYFNRKLRRATVVSNNRYYLSWRITPKKFIDCMRHAKCITDDDTRFIKCQTYDHDKIDETLCVVRDLTIEKYAVFIDCLRRTEQHLYADISELGGVTVKAKSIHDECDKLEEKEKTIIERINKVRDKKHPWSLELETEIDILRRHGIEILDAVHDRGIIIWFWVHTEEGHEQIHTWRDADYMEPYLTKLFNIFGRWMKPIDGELNSDWVIINGFQFNREVINLPMTLYMATELVVDTSRGPVRGVAALHDKFYILHPKSILIYNDTAPFDRAGEIDSADFGSLTDIAACAKSSRLYAVDEGNTCIWKVAVENNQVEKWMSDVTRPFTCSVYGSSGEVVVVRQGSPSNLDVYGPDGSRIRRLELTGLQYPLHAVETRCGNYDVLDEGALVEMTKDGVVTRHGKSFNQQDLEPLKKSRHLAIDIGERLYVAEGDRILQFDSQLVYEQVLLESPKIKDPSRLHFFEKKKRLMIVHSGGQKVFVYNARPRD